MIKIFADIQPSLTALKRLGIKLSDQSEAMQEIGDYLKDRTLQGFQKGVYPSGKPWTPLSPATVARKQRSGQGTRILIATGKMRDSVRVVVTLKSVQLVVDFPSQFHQSGTRKMPQRQILPDGKLPTRDERNIKDIVVNYLDV